MKKHALWIFLSILLSSLNTMADIPRLPSNSTKSGGNFNSSRLDTLPPIANSNNFDTKGGMVNSASENGRTYTPPPFPPQASVRLRVDSHAETPKLLISRRMLDKLNRMAEKEGHASTGHSGDSGRNVALVRSIVGGTLISLAFVMAGIWLSRSRRSARGSRVISSILVFTIGATGAVFVYGDAADPRPGVDMFTSRTLSLDVRRNGSAYAIAEIELTDETKPFVISPDVELIVPLDARDKRGDKKDDEE